MRIPSAFPQQPQVRLLICCSSSKLHLPSRSLLSRYRRAVMPSTTPFGNPGNPTGPGLSETPIYTRKIAALPRNIREKQNLERGLARGTGALVLNPFRSLVASPATPNTPTPVPSLGSGRNSASFNPSPLCGGATPNRSFSPFSTSNSSPPDSPYPSTPTLSPFDPDPSVAEGDKNDVDPFETSARVVGKVEKALMVDVSTVPLKRGSQCVNHQESLSPLISAEGMVRLSQADPDVLALGRSASHLEKPFTRGTPISFHDTPRQYMLAPKSNNSAPNAVFVLRSSPQIIEESSDEEFGPEDREDDDKTVYSFPCEDSKINELVSMMVRLSLGMGSTIARPDTTPARVRARTPVSPPVAVFHNVLARPSTARHATPMEVDKDVLSPRVANEGTSHPQKISESVPMDGIVFHPEVRDMEMADAFATNSRLPR
ncbi:hypothetical protein BDM02DRAFT_280946 [Thelephora ganbajun]|uniref:Uncharacterized protein n=1 Tax=Thelephora ganbajun TaxID=370292 RepID=A0ACB6Z968_THEGA|nr:hypothetical protein BDM02DRAFT_280946 [Thelephora ganbajun]